MAFDEVEEEGASRPVDPENAVRMTTVHNATILRNLFPQSTQRRHRDHKDNP